MYILVLVFPLISSIISGLFGRKVGERGAGIFTSISIFLTFCVSSLILFEVAFNGASTYLHL
jgi:NADH:ubiquinone oxidoreductase subunit 5 (subunit L)/multisubunit Na+/H+ antiporter MnhA subunit